MLDQHQMMRLDLLAVVSLGELALPSSSIGPHAHSSSGLKLLVPHQTSLEVAVKALNQLNRIEICFLGCTHGTYMSFLKFWPKVDSSNMLVIKVRTSKV